MKGLELSKCFYLEFGEKMIHEGFSDIESKLAIGLVGAGSECFGFDDSVSTDHDFDPGFLIFIPDDIDEKTAFRLQREYAKLPMSYLGYKREVMSPVGGNRRGVKKISDFLYEKTGTRDGNLSYRDFITVSEESLAELTNGEIWRDDSKYFTNLRLKLSVQPRDVVLKKLAGELLLMAQSGQYNYKRIVSHDEFGAARLALYEFVRATIHATFLLNEVYMPYYKWQFKSMRSLYWPSNVKDKSKINNIGKIENESYQEIPYEKILISLLNVSDEKIFADKVLNDVEHIARLFVDRLKMDGLSNKDDIYLGTHAYEVNNNIKDIDLRNANIFAAV